MTRPDRTHFEIYSRVTLRGRRWFWRLRAGNGEIIAQGQPYRHAASAIHAAGLVRATDTDTPVEMLS